MVSSSKDGGRSIFWLSPFDFHSLSDDVDGPGLNGGAVTSVGHQVVGSGGI